MESSFKTMPEQLDWAFFGLIVYCAFLFVNSSNSVAWFSLLTSLILLNGWVSSRATKTLYSDALLAVDMLAMCSYFAMVLILAHSNDEIEPRFWVACAGVSFSYLLWDVAILPLVGRDAWKKRFQLYVVLMVFTTFFFLCFYFVSISHPYLKGKFDFLGIVLWVALLAKWHYDKIRDCKDVQNSV